MDGIQNFENRNRTFFDKSKAIKHLPIPKILKELKSFFGSLNQNIKFVPNLASLGSPHRPLLNKKSIFQWNDDHTKAFEKIKQEIINLTENTHFDVKRNTRVKTDASHNGLGASLEQLHGSDWKTRYGPLNTIKITFTDRSLKQSKITKHYFLPFHPITEIKHIIVD